MDKAIFNAQEFLRDIKEDESKRDEFLKYVIEDDGYVIRLDMNDRYKECIIC